MNFEIDPREINLQGPDGMQLVKLLRGLIAAIESGGDEPDPGEDSEFFYCTYGTTTYSEIQSALADGKVPICIRNGLYYYLVNTTQNRYVFACYNPTNNYIYAVRCLTDRWDNVTFMIQERLTWDYAPTQGSTRPVTSGGVWTALQNAGGSDIGPYQQYPEMDGVASPGSSDDYARGDHVHPTDTSRAAASEITRIDAALATKADQASIEQTIEDTVDDWLSTQAPTIGTLSYAAKQALLACFRKVAWIDDQGQSYYNALESELFPDATLESITAVFTQSGAVIYDTDSLDTLRQYLVVTATYSDSTSETVTGYTLSGTLVEGTSTITVSYGGKTDTFTVAVTKYWDFEWDYTQGTPIGKGFAHLTAVVGSMTEEGYRLEGTSSGGCNLITDPTTTADIGVSEITIMFNQIYPSMIGFHFDVKGLWAAIINSNKLGYKISANNPGEWNASDVVQVQNIAINTGVEYTFRLEWNTASGATLWLNGEQMYSINSALTQANRTRWFIAVPGDCVVIVKSMRVKVVS